MKDSESLLVPLFNDVFIQPYEEAMIYAHYTLHDISETKIVSGIDSETGDYIVNDINYRYDKNGKKMMIRLSDEEKSKYDYIRTYNRYNNCYSKLSVVYDDLGYGDEKFNTYVSPDGTTYGFYLIDSYMSNTSDSFQTTGISADGDIIDKLKFFKYINDISLIDHKYYVAAVYTQLLPFIKQQPLSAMGDARALLNPRIYYYPLIYSQQKSDTSNGSNEVDIVMTDRKIKQLELLRYFHGITPLIEKKTSVDNFWRLKLKDVNKDMIQDGKYISIGDSPLYSVDASIYEYPPINVYSASPEELDIKDWNNVTKVIYPFEWKHYNASHYRILDKKIIIEYPELMKYDDLLKIETKDEAFKQLNRRINTPMKQQITDDEIQYIFNLYDVSWKSDPIKLNFSRKEKLYKLKLIFTLK